MMAEKGPTEGAIELETDSSSTLFSPVQEQHIDFLLEEEFAPNPQFLCWFLENVTWRTPAAESGCDDSLFVKAHSDWNCRATRSVTTLDGETDVLVIYRSAEGNTAILIEDKIRAGFQPTQPERYRRRGEEGKRKGLWAFYWTCLVAPERYAPGNREFDAVCSLEKLCDFFSAPDPRSRFKTGVLTRAVEHFQQTGLQRKDDVITAFRAFSAAEAEVALTGTGIKWPKSRDAWWGDTWFTFTGGGLPPGVEVLYKSHPGHVDLTFPKTAIATLRQALSNCPRHSFKQEIITKQTGKSAAVRIEVYPVVDFTDLAAAKRIIRDALEQVRYLVDFYNQNENLLSRVLTAN